jgi:CheY-like chemotaxis protein/ketosteroid isomerase-like protein
LSGRRRSWQIGSVPDVRAKVLIADDEADLREALAEVLSGEGYQVTAVASAETALEMLDSQIFRAVLTDAFSVNRGRGLEQVDAIVQRARPTPVGLISGWPLGEDEPPKHGLRFAMLKPFDVGELLVQLAQALGDPLDPSRSEPAQVVHRYFAALGEKDWNALVSLCAEQVRFAGPQGSRFSAALVGREALRKHSQETFAVFRDAKFTELVCYQTPGGVAVRYLGTWTRDGVPMQQAGTALLQVEGGRIQRIGVEMNQSLLDRLAPS